MTTPLRFEAWIVDALSAHDASHDVVHARNVARIASDILRTDVWETIVDPDARRTLSDVCRYTAMVHDFCDRKYALDVGERVREIGLALRDCGVDDEVRERVCLVAPLISFSRRKEHGPPAGLDETNMRAYLVVSDADMLEAMGITGFARTFMFQAASGRTSAGAYEYVRDNLFLCEEFLHHEYSKSEGRRRASKMRNACDWYIAERSPL